MRQTENQTFIIIIVYNINNYETDRKSNFCEKSYTSYKNLYKCINTNFSLLLLAYSTK